MAHPRRQAPAATHLHLRRGARISSEGASKGNARHSLSGARGEPGEGHGAAAVARCACAGWSSRSREKMFRFYFLSVFVFWRPHNFAACSPPSSGLPRLHRCVTLRSSSRLARAPMALCTRRGARWTALSAWRREGEAVCARAWSGSAHRALTALRRPTPRRQHDHPPPTCRYAIKEVNIRKLNPRERCVGRARAGATIAWGERQVTPVVRSQRMPHSVT